MTLKIQLKRDTAINWSTNNPILAAGEVGIETDTKQFKFGDGTTAWNSLTYGDVSKAWGDIKGTLTDQKDLTSKLLSTDYNIKLIEDALGTEDTGTFPTELTTARNGLSNGVLINRQHIAKTNMLVDKFIIPSTCVGTNPVTTKIYVVEFDYENSSYTKIDEAEVTINAAENMLSKPLYVKAGQALGLWYRGGLKFGYTTKTPVTTYPEYNMLLWAANTELPASGTASTITNPTQGFLLDWSFGYKAVNIPDFETEITNLNTKKVDNTAFEPIHDMFSEHHIEVVENGHEVSTNNLKGPTNLTWLIKNFKAEHTGYISSININLGGASSSAPTTARPFSIGTIKITPTDPDDPSMVGTWECHDKLLDIDLPSYSENGLKVVTLPRPLYIEAGDYIVIGGTVSTKTIGLQYNTPGAGSSALNRINTVFTDPNAMSGNFNGWQDQFSVTGISYNLDWIVYTDPFTSIEELDTRIDKIEDDLNWLVDEKNVFTKIFPVKPSLCSPSTSYWIDLRDKVVADGFIHNIKLAQNTSTSPIEAAIAAFEVTGSVADNTQSATITRIKKFILPAGALEYSFPKTDLFEVKANEYVSVCIPGQIYYGGSGLTNNIINGGSINSKVGDVLKGRYTGSLQMDQMFTWCMSKDIQGKVELLDEHLEVLDERGANLSTSTSYKDLTSVMLIGSSLTEASYCPSYTSWPERLQDAVDVTIYNNGLSGANIFTNLARVSKHEDIRFAPGNRGGESRCNAFDLHPTYFLWDDCANGSPTGLAAIELYRKVKSVVESYGSKLLIGSEENYANQYNAYEHTQQAFSREARVPYSAITRIQQKCYPRNNAAVCPYPVNGANHAGYRANAPYQVHKDLLDILPIYKNIKLFRPRTTYKNGNPTIQDLTYDNNLQRLNYWTSLHPGQGAATAPGHIDNLDNASGINNDVPGTTNVNPYSSRTEPADLFQGSDLYFDKWALMEIITEKVGATKGTLEFDCSIQPTKVYVANLKSIIVKGAGANVTYAAGDVIDYFNQNKAWKVLRDFTSTNPWSEPDPADAISIDLDNYACTEFEEIPFTYEAGKVTAQINNTAKTYQVYDKFRFIVYYDGGQFRLSKPRLYDYDGVAKVLPETIPYHQRKFGTELLDAVNPTTWTTISSGAAARTLPAPIANYTLYNDTLSHIQLNDEKSYIQKNVSITNPGYKRVAVRIVAQIWNKIATIRYDGTEYENTEYITNDKTDTLGAAAYINSDYDYGIIKVKINTNICKTLIVYPGWCELYFEADLTPDDTSLTINIMKQSYIDDSFVNYTKPIFIHHVSVQDITDYD